MSQAATDGKSLLDPFGFWKAARDANLEAWSKMMIDVVNSDEYSRTTGLALEQILAASQPVRDATEQTMTQTLSMLNMPSRAEVISLAERLVNVEMLLDDMDAKLSAMQKSLQETIKETVRKAIPAQNDQLTNVAAQLDALDAKYNTMKKIEANLAELSTKLSSLQVAVPTPVAVQPVTVPKVEPKPQPKAEARPTQPAKKDVLPVEKQEAK